METTDTIRVMIVDDHDMVRDGLGLMIDTCEDFEHAGEAKSGDAAMMVVEREKPDVILMDIMMPGKSGIEATKDILNEFPDIRVIALTSFDTVGMVEQALKAGAMSYLRKNVGVEKIAEAIRAAYKGQATLSPEATEELIALTVRPPKPGYDLTEREWDVLEQLVKGHNNREIAEELVISPSTVKHHVSSILRKLDANNRAEAVAIAMENKLIE